jgi:LmbE family N-acetylglucosaminyl deacetylase
LSGLEKIETRDNEGNIQQPWRPKVILEYIQWMDLEPDIVVDIIGSLTTKMDAVKAYETQFFDPESKEAEPPFQVKTLLIV